MPHQRRRQKPKLIMSPPVRLEPTKKVSNLHQRLRDLENNLASARSREISMLRLLEATQAALVTAGRFPRNAMEALSHSSVVRLVEAGCSDCVFEIVGWFVDLKKKEAAVAVATGRVTG